MPIARPRLLPPALVANWQNPLIFSWSIADALLEPFLPPGLELDRWRDSAYISLVGLRFDGVRLFGLPVPQGGYDEINLRFYVRRQASDGDIRPGVVFIRQVVPHRATAFAARVVYGEPFLAAPTRHLFDPPALGDEGLPDRVAYQWAGRGDWQQFWAEADGDPATPAVGSMEAFLTRRYWGYNGKPGRRTRAYHLTRPDWRLRRVSSWGIKCDFTEVYDSRLAESMLEEPASVLLATGCVAAVSLPGRLTT